MSNMKSYIKNQYEKLAVRRNPFHSDILSIIQEVGKFNTSKKYFSDYNDVVVGILHSIFPIGEVKQIRINNRYQHVFSLYKFNYNMKGLAVA